MEYYISAIRYSSNGNQISHVLLHTIGEKAGRLSTGEIRSKTDVINLIKDCNNVATTVYNYEKGEWYYGAEVNFVQNSSILYLRTNPDSTVQDNLGNLPLIDELR